MALASWETECHRPQPELSQVLLLAKKFLNSIEAFVNTLEIRSVPSCFIAQVSVDPGVLSSMISDQDSASAHNGPHFICSHVVKSFQVVCVTQVAFPRSVVVGSDMSFMSSLITGGTSSDSSEFVD